MRRYCLRPLPIKSCEFWNLKREEEHIGLAYLYKDQLEYNYRTKDFLNKILIPYFKEGIQVDDLGEHTSNHDDMLFYQFNVEPFAKTLWLTDEFLKGDMSFRNPIGVHWQPESSEIPDDDGTWQIHPGGNRQMVIYYFHPEDKPVEVMLFNTCGKEVEFERTFDSYDELTHFYVEERKSSPFFVLVAEEGTVIPHMLTEINDIHPNGAKYHYHMREWFFTTELTANFNIEEYVGEYKKHDIKRRTHIRVDYENFEDNITRAMLVAPIRDNYEGNGFTITTTES